MGLFSKKKLEDLSTEEKVLAERIQIYLDEITDPGKVAALKAMAYEGVNVLGIPQDMDYSSLKLLHNLTEQKGVDFVNGVVDQNFSASQLRVIAQGIEQGLDVSYIMNTKLRDKQMLAILDALEHGLNPAPLLDGDKSEMIMHNLIKRMLVLKEDGRFKDRLNKPDLTDDEVLAMFSELNGKSEIKSNGSLKKFTDFQMLFNGELTGSLKTTTPFTGNLTSVGGMSCDLDFEAVFDANTKMYTIKLLFAESVVYEKSGISPERPILIGDVCKLIKELNSNGDLVKADILIVLSKPLDGRKQFRLGSFSELHVLLERVLSKNPATIVSLLTIDNQIVVNFLRDGKISADVIKSYL